MYRSFKESYDDTLTWPYTGTVTFEIINWKGDRDHVKWTADFSEEGAIAAGQGRPQRIWSWILGGGYGHAKALSHNNLHGSNSQYVNNDILCIRVSSITV